MSIEDSFLQHVCEAPDDDVPRLIWADWLQEHGCPERAEFIRTQCRLAAGVADSAERRTLQDRVAELLRAHEEQWAGPLLGLVRKVRFRRGFIEQVTLTAADFIESGEPLFALAPIREAVVVQAGPGISQLASCPHLARLRALDFRECQFEPEDGDTLLRSPYVAGLRELVARFSPLSRGLAVAYAEAPQAPALETLDFYEGELTPQALETLAASPRCRSLRRLILGGSNLGGAMAGSLARSPHLGNLVVLHLAFAQLGAEDAEALANTTSLPALRHLDLGGNPIGPRGARALANSPHRRRWESLNLTGAGLKGKTVAGLRNVFGDRVIL